MAAGGSQPGDDAASQASDKHRLIAGRYRLRAELGSGSMGTVWSGYDEFLHRPVAVKGIKLPPGFPAAQAEEQRERALREARAIAALSHPNVITLYDVVREDGEPFVVMELLTARSLAGLIADNGPLSLEQAAEVGDAVAAALEAAHAAGITHRDVKPGNVLVARDGRIKLTDFGIARNISDLTLTKSGLMLGSPAYMAPELASGKKVSPAADLWGLGAMLFTALEGEPPYDADGDPLATAAAVVHDEVPQPSPGPLATLIGTLMSKDPALRPDLATVRDALFDLRPQPGRPLFDPALFDIVDVDEPGREPADAAGETEVAEEPPSTGTTAPLAADPGPLPFAAGGRNDRRSARLALVGAIAVAAFLIASAGGFALTRTLAGLHVLPAAGEQQLGTGSAAIGPLVTQRGDATVLNGDNAGRFQVDVPAGWTRFVTQQQAGTLPASTLVQFVSANGHLMVGVERFPDYFPDNDADDYLNGLRSFWPADGFVLVDGTDGAALDEPVDVTYRTIETQTSPQSGLTGTTSAQPTSKVIGRTTFARLIRDGASLWVVRVTVPTEQESRGRAELFEHIVPTFDVG